MPIYEYRCRGCGHEFEEWQKISDKPIRKCPKCAARRVEKLVSMTSFQLKGGGWYADGYGSTKSGASGSGGSASGAGESKSPPKKEKKEKKGKGDTSAAAA